MKRLIFCCEPFQGHAGPMLKLVQELAARDAEITVYISDKFKDAVQAAGASFCSVPSQETYQKKPGYFETELVDFSYDVLQQVLDSARAEQPECIVYDSMCFWGMLLAKILRAAAIRFHVQFPINDLYHPFDPYSPVRPFRETYPELERDLSALCSLYMLPAFTYPELLYQAEPLNILCFVEQFFPAREKFDERFHFVGPFIAPEYKTDTVPSEKVLYISLGTTEHNALPAFYDICLSAFGGQAQQVIMSTGDTIDYELFGPLPENVMMKPFVPQMEMLQKTDVFITHGGTNSIMEALYYGVPMLVIPLTREHMLMAERLEELRLGLVIKNAAFITAHMLRKAVAQLKEDQEIRSELDNMREIVRKSGGYQLAADLIMRSVS